MRTTLGIRPAVFGHLVIESDEEWGHAVGTPVSPERVTELFEADIQSVIRDCHYLLTDFYGMPESARVTAASLMFQLGLSRSTKFIRH